MPIYRNKETGYEVEVMRGTRLPKVYEEVKARSATKSDKSNQNDKTSKDNKTATQKKNNAKTDKNASGNVSQGPDTTKNK